MAFKMRNMGKRGQITLFVFVAIIIVAGILLVFLVQRAPRINIGQSFEPESFLDACIREEVKEVVDEMIPQGGFVNPKDFKLYNDLRVTYLCKNINYYEPCVAQHPNFISVLEQEIRENLQERTEECFILLEDELDKRNYEHEGGDVDIDVVLNTGQIEIDIFRDFVLSRNGEVREFDNFRILLTSSLYDLGWLANEIVSQEAKFCYFENAGFNILYPEFDVRKDSLSDSTKIYSIENKKTGEEMNIAIRGCAIPAGF